MMLIYFFGSRDGSCQLRPAMRGRRITVAVCSLCLKSSTGKAQIRFDRRLGLCEDCFAHLSCKICDMSYTCMIVFFYTYLVFAKFIYLLNRIFFLCDRRGLTVSQSVVHSCEVFSVLLLLFVQGRFLVACIFSSPSCASSLFRQVVWKRPSL